MHGLRGSGGAASHTRLALTAEAAARPVHDTEARCKKRAQRAHLHCCVVVLHLEVRVWGLIGGLHVGLDLWGWRSRGGHEEQGRA